MDRVVLYNVMIFSGVLVVFVSSNETVKLVGLLFSTFSLLLLARYAIKL